MDNTLPITNAEDVRIKEEPQDETTQPSWHFHPSECVNLLSDDEDDTMNLTGRPVLQSPIDMQRFSGERDDDRMPDFSEEAAIAQTTTGDNHTSTPAVDAENIQMSLDNIRAIQKMYADKYRTQNPPKTPNVDEDLPPTPPAPKSRGGRGIQDGKKDAAAADFEKLKQQYQKKKKANTMSIEEEIEFIKAESSEMARLRKLQADEEFDRATSTDSADSDDGRLFVSEIPAAPNSSAMHSDEDMDVEKPKKRGRKRLQAEDGDDGQMGSRKRAKTTGAAGKKPKKVSGQDYTADDVEDVLERARHQSTKGKGKGKGKAKKAVPAKAKAGSRKKAGPSMTNTASIMGTNVFEDTAATADLPNQPGFASFDKGPRRNALNSLIASIPVDCQKSANKEKTYMDKAITAFTGKASVKPESDGNWSVKGMRSHLKHYQARLYITSLSTHANSLGARRGLYART